jgi:antitoxin FitA
MAKNIQVRNVPDAVLRRLKARAEYDGMSLSEHLLIELTRLASLPTRQEMQDRLAQLTEAKLSRSAAQVIRRERGSA